MFTVKSCSISSTGSSFWNNLEDDLEKIGKNVRKKLHQNKNNNIIHSTSPTSQIITRSIDMSLNQIRSIQTQQNSKEQSLKNKLFYHSIDKNRKTTSTQLARRKYQKVLQIRHQSFLQKSILLKERNNYLSHQQQKVKSQADKIKMQKKQGRKSIDSNFHIVSEKADQVRAASSNNKNMIEAYKQNILKLKNQQCRKGKEFDQNSQKRLKLLKDKKIESGKINHQQKIRQQYKALKSHSIRNTILAGKIQKQILKINQQKLIAIQQLNQYSTFLGINIKPKHQQSKAEPKSTNFYITNL